MKKSKKIRSGQKDNLWEKSNFHSGSSGQENALRYFQIQLKHFFKYFLWIFSDEANNIFRSCKKIFLLLFFKYFQITLKDVFKYFFFNFFRSSWRSTKRQRTNKATAAFSSELEVLVSWFLVSFCIIWDYPGWPLGYFQFSVIILD